MRGVRKIERFLKTGPSADHSGSSTELSNTEPSSTEVEVVEPPQEPDIRFLYSNDDDGDRAAVFDALVAEIRSRGISVITGGERIPYRSRINVYQKDVQACFLAAVDVLGVERIRVKYHKRWQQIEPGGELEHALAESTNVDAIVFDDGFVPPDPTIGDAPVSGLWLEVVAWSEQVGAYQSPYLETHRSNVISKRLRPRSFERLAAEHHHLGELPPADRPNFPIDIVYTWVDGDDPTWLEKKAETQEKVGVESEQTRAVNVERFRNRDELKYSLRSIEEYAPWVRTIHIVTAGQCPPWLNLDHPKLRLVDHADIYANTDWLPTFNSSGIETQLHHVPDLADKFLYFNDDFFLGDHCWPADFFYGNGVIKYFPSSQMAYEHDIDSTSEEYIQADKNAIELFADKYDAVNRHIMQHVPYPSDRLLLEELEANYADEFAACAREPFRSSNDLRPIAFMQYHYGYPIARAMPSGISHRYLALWKDVIVEQLENVLLNGKKTFCINDVGLQPERTAEINDKVIEFLEAYFPTKSAFEK